ncbi:MAG: ComEC family competence protein [bacterium]|jgi:competence protein ComEC
MAAAIAPARKYPAVIALIGVISGILIAEYLPFSSYPYIVLSLLLFAGTLLCFFQGRNFLSAFLGILTLVCLSAFGYAFRIKTFPPGHISHFVDNDRPLEIYGTIDDWPVLKDRSTEIYLQVDSLAAERQIVHSSGRILLRIMTPTTRLQYGDRIIFESRVYSVRGGRNPSGLDYRRYLVLKEVFGVAYQPHQFAIQVDPVGAGNIRRAIGQLRTEIVGVFKRTLGQREAALASGFLIGETRDIPRDIYDLFRDSGTLHLLAVSGSNVALVVMFFAFIFRASPFNAMARTLLLILIILIFSFLSYNQPSVVRASIMASLVLLGKLLQKRIDYNNIVAATALLILAVKPTELFDIGFQLSFVCAWGIIFFVPKISALFFRWRRTFVYRFVGLPLIVCFIAQLVSVPLTGFYFHRLPLISFAANLVIVPLVGIIVVGEVILLVLSFILPLAGDFAGGLLNPLLSLNISLLRFFGDDSMTLQAGGVIDFVILIFYYLFFIFLVAAIRDVRYRRILVILILVALNVFSIRGLVRAEPQFRMTILSIPEGLAAVTYTTPAKVILANMPHRDYSYAELLITPLLYNRGFTDPEIIALDGDYDTVLEALRVARNGASRLYLPLPANNLYHDILVQHEMKPPDSQVIFYAESDSMTENNSSVLHPGIITFHLEAYSLTISSRDGLTQNMVDSEYPSHLYAMPVLDLEIWQFMARQSSLQYLVCNRITKEARPRIEAYQSDPQNHPFQLFETSEVGAVEITLKNGRLKVEN